MMCFFFVCCCCCCCLHLCKTNGWNLKKRQVSVGFSEKASTQNSQVLGFKLLVFVQLTGCGAGEETRNDRFFSMKAFVSSQQ